MDTGTGGFSRIQWGRDPMKRAAAMRPCLASAVCRDVGVKVGFGIGCAGAHVSTEVIHLLVQVVGKFALKSKPIYIRGRGVNVAILDIFDT